MTAEEMYQEIILDYARNPHHFGTIEQPDIVFKDTNPSCGDMIEIQIQLDPTKKTIADIKFNGKGCAISQASASMLTEYFQKKKIDDVTLFTKEHLLTMLNIPLSGIRLKCALLSLKVLKYGTYHYLGKTTEDDHDYA